MVKTLLRLLAPASLLLAALTWSCNSIFDSYYPASAELVEGQWDLQGQFASPLTDIQMRALTSYGQYLAIRATGENTKLFVLDTKTMTPVLTVLERKLREMNSGLMPKLLPISEEAADVASHSQNGLAFGEVSWNPYVRGGVVFAGTNLFQGTPGARAFWSGTQVCFTNDDLAIDQGTVLANLSGTFQSRVMPTSVYDFRLADLNGSSDWYGSIFNCSLSPNNARAAYLAYINSVAGYLTDSVEPGFTPGMSIVTIPVGDHLQSAWVTKTAAVLQTHPKSSISSVLQAYSWTGKLLAELPLENQDNDNTVISFDKEGRFWYMYDKHNGHIIQYRTWWQP